MDVGPSTPRSTLASITQRFVHGRPSNEPDAAGVFIHIWDLLEDPTMPWRPCMREACGRTDLHRQNRGQLERIPTSLIYANMPNRGKNGSVASPEP